MNAIQMNVELDVITAITDNREVMVKKADLETEICIRSYDLTYLLEDIGCGDAHVSKAMYDKLKEIHKTIGMNDIIILSYQKGE